MSEERDANVVSRLEANLGKLKRNLDQMTPEMRTKYKSAIDKMRSAILKDANQVYEDFLFGGRMFLDTKDDAFTNSAQAINTIIVKAENAGFKKRLMDWLFECWDLDLFLDALCPLHYQVWFEGYGKWYWAHKIEDKGEGLEPLRYYNPILDMWWHNEWREWCTLSEDGETGEKKPGFPVTIMLPPTMDLMEMDYRDCIEPFQKPDSKWRVKIPWLYSDQFKGVFPHLHPEENEAKQLTLNDMVNGTAEPERKKWL